MVVSNIVHTVKGDKGVREISCSTLHSQKNANYNKSVDILQQTCCQQADIRMDSHGLRQLIDDKSVASCQIVKTCSYPQVVSTSYNKSANDKLQQKSNFDRHVATL